jgi:uncharacterized protein UPF0175
MVSLTIDLPEEAFSALRVDPSHFAKELRFAAAVQWYHQGLQVYSNSDPKAIAARQVLTSAVLRPILEQL